MPRITVTVPRSGFVSVETSSNDATIATPSSSDPSVTTPTPSPATVGVGDTTLVAVVPSGPRVVYPRVFRGNGPPTSDEGHREGDTYLDELTGDLYTWAQ